MTTLGGICSYLEVTLEEFFKDVKLNKPKSKK
jgi:hypothetical protein